MEKTLKESLIGGIKKSFFIGSNGYYLYNQIDSNRKCFNVYITEEQMNELTEIIRTSVEPNGVNINKTIKYMNDYINKGNFVVRIGSFKETIVGQASDFPVDLGNGYDIDKIIPFIKIMYNYGSFSPVVNTFIPFYNIFNGSRSTKTTKISILCNLEKTNKNNSIVFLNTDKNGNTRDDMDEILKQLHSKGQKIALIPYSFFYHMSVLVIDVEKFCSKNPKESINYFDSSHCLSLPFVNFAGSIKNNLLNGDPNTKDKLGNNGKPINNSIFQGLEGTCTFYSEAFLLVVNDVLAKRPNTSLNDIIKLVNSESFKDEVEYRKNVILNRFSENNKNLEQTKNENNLLEAKLQNLESFTCHFDEERKRCFLVDTSSYGYFS